MNLDLLLKNPTVIALIVGFVFLNIASLFMPKKGRKAFNKKVGGKQQRPKSIHTNIRSRRIVNESEARLLAILTGLFPDYYVFPQVSFNALITHAPHIANIGWRNAVRSKFNSKSVDFVLCKKDNFEVVAIIEYDGQGHNYEDDAIRDDMLKTAGYRVERFDANYTIENIKNRFQLLVQTPIVLANSEPKYQEKSVQF